MRDTAKPLIRPSALNIKGGTAEAWANLRILILDSNAERATIVEAGLAGLGTAAILRASGLPELTADVTRTGADIIIVACDSPDRDILEGMRELHTRQPRPIVMFVERSDRSLAEEALKVGISAYVVDGLSAGRVSSILDIAISRFRMFQSLHNELEKAKSDLALRKVIERAKGILMERNHLSEPEAYDLLRRSAMEDGRTIADVANAVIAVTRLLKS